MVRKRVAMTAALITISISISLSGCSGNPAPNTAKTDNVNQARTASNNNNVSVAPPINSTPVVNNASTLNANKKSAPPVKEPTPQVGSGGNDFSLFAQARTAISSDPELLNSVIVEIKEGNATLTGNVKNEAQKTKAGQLVQGVSGIKSVKNNLRVSP